MSAAVDKQIIGVAGAKKHGRITGTWGKVSLLGMVYALVLLRRLICFPPQALLPGFLSVILWLHRQRKGTLMHSSLKLGAVLGLASLGLAALPAAQAQTTPVYYSGNFTQDDNVKLFTFDVTSPGSVILYTTSYGGGPNVNGTSSGPGGFDTILTLFDSTGTFIDQNDDNAQSIADPTTGATFDAELQDTLAAGTYQVALTEYDNFSNGNLSDGFAEDGQGNFTGTDFGSADQAGLGFIDVTQAQRTSFFNLNIGNGTLVAAVPEASTTVSFGLLLALGLGGFALAAKKKKSMASQ